MPIKTKDVVVNGGAAVDLKKWPTRVPSIYETRRQFKELLAEHVTRLSELQELLYASNQHALLIIFQAMDAAGKDGAIKHVMSGVNPQGCRVTSFSHPSAAELQHDFLWRTTRELPARGQIGIFNRSYYEEVLIVRVQPEILAAEAVPNSVAKEHKVWDERYMSINDFETHMHLNGTRLVKFFLHISKEEQRKRLLERIDDHRKNWKIAQSDLDARKHWKLYRRAYEDCLSATSTECAPWHVIPADDKPTARLLVSQVILEALERLKMKLPEPTPGRIAELKTLRAQLVAG